MSGSSEKSTFGSNGKVSWRRADKCFNASSMYNNISKSVPGILGGLKSSEDSLLVDELRGIEILNSAKKFGLCTKKSLIWMISSIHSETCRIRISARLELSSKSEGAELRSQLIKRPPEIFRPSIFCLLNPNIEERELISLDTKRAYWSKKALK